MSEPTNNDSLTDSEALLNPHAVLDSAVPNTPSGQIVTTADGVLVHAKHDDHAELVPDSTQPVTWQQGARPGDAAIIASTNDAEN